MRSGLGRVQQRTPFVSGMELFAFLHQAKSRLSHSLSPFSCLVCDREQEHPRNNAVKVERKQSGIPIYHIIHPNPRKDRVLVRHCVVGIRRCI